MNLVGALVLLGGGSLSVWAGIADPPGGILGAIGRVLRGEPAGGTPSDAGAISSSSSSSSGASKTVAGERTWPTTSHVISQAYGVPNSRYEAGYHTGLDINGETGDPLYAPVAGRIVGAGPYGAYGNAVRIKAGGYLIIMAHMDSIGAGAIVGRRVAAGAFVGRMGQTGNADGSHLHLEVRRAPFNYGDDVDPAVVLP